LEGFYYLHGGNYEISKKSERKIKREKCKMRSKADNKILKEQFTSRSWQSRLARA
jgi:hypothetical protein